MPTQWSHVLIPNSFSNVFSSSAEETAVGDCYSFSKCGVCCPGPSGLVRIWAPHPPVLWALLVCKGLISPCFCFWVRPKAKTCPAHWTEEMERLYSSHQPWWWGTHALSFFVCKERVVTWTCSSVVQIRAMAVCRFCCWCKAGTEPCGLQTM